ncbi:MAG: hypothetical protein Q8Q51_01895 [Lutibacter sp.]|nr:hypothetical protein [Lutibacter sp.]
MIFKYFNQNETVIFTYSFDDLTPEKLSVRLLFKLLSQLREN